MSPRGMQVLRHVVRELAVERHADRVRHAGDEQQVTIGRRLRDQIGTMPDADAVLAPLGVGRRTAVLDRVIDAPAAAASAWPRCPSA